MAARALASGARRPMDLPTVQGKPRRVLVPVSRGFSRAERSGRRGSGIPGRAASCSPRPGRGAGGTAEVLENVTTDPPHLRHGYVSIPQGLMWPRFRDAEEVCHFFQRQRGAREALPGPSPAGPSPGAPAAAATRHRSSLVRRVNVPSKVPISTPVSPSQDGYDVREDGFLGAACQPLQSQRRELMRLAPWVATWEPLASTSTARSST